MVDRICTVEDCGRAHQAKGLCGRHYQTWTKYGDATVSRGIPKGVARAFFENARKSTAKECINWPYNKNGVGYGSLAYEGRSRDAHRLMCRLTHGDPPPGKWDAAHKCGNRACVNPNHITWKSRRDNLADCELHGTKRRGEKIHNARLTEDDVRCIRSLAGDMTQQAIGDLYGLHQSYVSAIVLRKAWGHVV